MSEELEHIWSRVQDELAQAVDAPTYRIWLAPLRARELNGGRLVVEAPAQACQWIRDRFGRLLQASVQRALGPEVALELRAIDGLAAGAHGGAPGADGGRPRRAGAGRAGGGRGGAGAGAHGDAPGDADAQLELQAPAGAFVNPKLTFDQFVIGDCNRLAHAAALTVAEMPAQAYNPLFICGPPGVGKTHLLSSIASLLLAHSPGLTVRTTTGEAFTNEFLGALGGGQIDHFKARFRHIDVLLVDDVQFLERKTKTEEEFFHTFNALYDGGRQIVLTSDRPPHDLQALEDRLRERFQAGLVADIQPPDMVTRLAILRKRAQHDRIELADELALPAIAHRVEHNVRALEGALIRVVAYSSLTGRALTGELADEVLDSFYPRPRVAPGRSGGSIEDIQAVVGEHFELSREELLSSARTPRISWPRQVAMYLARELSGQSLPAIGRSFGGRDHTTVLHAWRRTLARIAEDEQARETVDKLRLSLTGHHDHPAGGSPDRPA